MDKIIRGFLNKGKVRVLLADTSNTCFEICKNHNLNEVISDAFSRIISISSIMGICQKTGKLNVILQGNGAIKYLVCDSDSEGNTRGYISLNDNNVNNIEEAIGNKGMLKVIKDFGMKQNFSGEIDYDSSNIGEIFSTYFYKSEQCPSVVKTGCHIEKDSFRSGALLLQLMPGYDELDITYCENFIKNCPSIYEIIRHDHLEEVLKELFPDIEILSIHDIQSKCNCSKEKFIEGIATLNKDEINSMINEHKEFEVKCNFCNKAYYLNEEDLKEALNIRLNKKVN